MLLAPLVLFCGLGLLCLVSFADASGGASPPTVNLKNGTYTGRYLAEYDQDLFLGIPYAQPPLGDLRFSQPLPLDTSWNNSKSATEYSDACVGYDSSHGGYNVSEDCLYLNIVRPSGVKGKLPVAFWIHGISVHSLALIALYRSQLDRWWILCRRRRRSAI